MPTNLCFNLSFFQWQQFIIHILSIPLVVSSNNKSLFCYLPLVCEFEYTRIFHNFTVALFNNLGKGSRVRGNLPLGIQHGDEFLCQKKLTSNLSYNTCTNTSKNILYKTDISLFYSIYIKKRIQFDQILEHSIDLHDLEVVLYSHMSHTL